jgi:hypothetical protein
MGKTRNYNKRLMRRQRIKRGEENATYTDNSVGAATKEQRKLINRLLLSLGHQKYYDPQLTKEKASEIITSLYKMEQKT